MTTINQAAQLIKDGGVIAIVRGQYSIEALLGIGEALQAGGVTIMEVTLNTSGALAALPQLRGRFGGELLIGAGTVRSLSQLKQALEAGAEFVVAPNFDPASVAHSLAQGVLHLPGVFTATEAQTAFLAGCRLVKLFPADTVGPAYLKALRAPLDDLEFVPTGGVSLGNIGDYARAGAAAVGLGSQLITGADQSPADLTARAKALRAAWDDAKHG